MSLQESERKILLVEDNPDDVFLMERLFRREKIGGKLEVVTDGKAAVDYLQEKMSQPTEQPHLIFLDLKLPFLGGFDVLSWIRHQPDLGILPVVILTSSLEDRDREKARSFGVPFLVKPPTAEMVRNAIDEAIKPASGS